MKTAIIGSRNLMISNLEKYLPAETDEIVSGGAKGIDKCAEEYAKRKGIKITLFLPDYNRYGRSAPIKRNDQIVDYADMVLAFWDGKSKGTKYVIDLCKKKQKPLKIYFVDEL